MKYSTPPSTDAAPAMRADFEDITRWNTSCWGMEPSIIVIQAAKNPRISITLARGQKSSLPAAAA